MSVDTLLKQRMSAINSFKQYPPASPIFSCIDCTNVSIKSFKLISEVPKTFEKAIENLKNSLFMTDPFEGLLHTKLEKEKEDEYHYFASETEGVCRKLMDLGIVQLAPDMTTQFDELISYTVEVQEGASVMYWDLRTYFYMNVIIPNGKAILLQL